MSSKNLLKIRGAKRALGKYKETRARREKEFDYWVDYNYRDPDSLVSTYDTTGEVQKLLEGGVIASSEEEHNVLLDKAALISDALEAEEERHSEALLSHGTTGTLQDLREGTVANVLEQNRREAFEEARDVMRLGQKQADIVRRRIEMEEANRRRAEKAQSYGFVFGVAGAAVGGALGGPAGAGAGYQFGTGVGTTIGSQSG